MDDQLVGDRGAVRIGRRDDILEEIGRLDRVAAALGDPVGEDAVELALRRLALAHLARRHPQGQHEFHPARKIAEQIEEFVAQLLLEIAPHEAVRGDIHHHRPQRLHQIEFAAVAEAIGQRHRLLGHHRHILLHRRRLEARHDHRALTEIFFHLREGVEVRREHLVEERHRLADRQKFVGFLEDEAVIVRPEQHDHPPPAHAKAEDRPALVIAIAQQLYRVAEEIRQMPQQG